MNNRDLGKDVFQDCAAASDLPVLSLPTAFCTGEEKRAFPFTPMPCSAPFPGCVSQLGAAGLALDFQVIRKAAAVLQLPVANRNNGQEASGLCVRALLPALLTLGPPLAPFCGFVPVLAGRFPTL